MKIAWKIEKLSDVFQIKPPKNEARIRLKDDDLVSFVPMEDLGILTKDFITPKKRRLKEVSGSYTYFSDNDVLLAKITPCFENGKMGIARNLTNGIGFGSSEYIVFRSSGKVTSDYLFYFLSTEQFREEGKKRMSGAVGHKRVSKDFVENYLIPFPESLTEQQHIVTILNKSFATITKLKKIAEKNLKNTRDIFEEELANIFTNIQDDWEKSKIEDYIKFIDYRGKTPKKTSFGLRLITAKNVKNGFMQQSPEEFINPADYDAWMTRGIPKIGDVLFTTEAPLANVAQLDTNDKVAFAQRIIIMQPQSDKINSTFLKYLLLSNPIKQKILEKGTGATVLGIKASLLKKINISFPKSITDQLKIVHKLDLLYTKTKQLEYNYQNKLVKLDDLKESILKKAFNGELTNVNIDIDSQVQA